MPNSIDFLPMIVRALHEPDPRTALAQAFERIHSLGEGAGYRVGYAQFLRFMATVRAAGTGDCASTALPPELNFLEPPWPIEIVVEREDRAVARRSFQEDGAVLSIDGIEPGPYRIKLITGLLLWEGHIHEEEVVWSKAFPNQPVKMAADTGQVARAPTRTVPLTEIGLCLRVYPGLESGSLQIEMREPEHGP